MHHRMQTGGRERGWTGEGYDACATGGASGSQWDPVTVSQSACKHLEVRFRSFHRNFVQEHKASTAKSMPPIARGGAWYL